LVFEAQQRGEIISYLMFKVSAMVRDQLFLNPKHSNNTVKEKEGYMSHGVIEHWHAFNPFGKIVNDHDNMIMVISRWGSTLHKFNSPFTKRIDCDDRMEGSGWSSFLRVK